MPLNRFIRAEWMDGRDQGNVKTAAGVLGNINVRDRYCY